MTPVAGRAARELREVADVLRKVLVAVDGSPAAAAVVEAARELCAGREGCRVTLLRVLPPPLPPAASAEAWAALSRDADLLAATERAARTELEPLRAELAGAGIPVEVDVAVGRPGEEIVRYARLGGYDLVVVGRRGLGPVAEMVLGSVSAYVVRHSPVPVLVVQPARREGVGAAPGGREADRR